MLHHSRALSLLAVVLSLIATPATIASAQGAPNCLLDQAPSFSFGFASLKASIGDAMGDPLECEHTNPLNGDSLQLTTTGLSFYRKATNTPTFTDGATHWAITGEGLLAWDQNSIDPPGTLVDVRCRVLPVRGFGQVFGTQPEAHELLGCPSYPTLERGIDLVVQRFEHGWMVWLTPAEGQLPQIIVGFDDDQRYAVFSDTFTEGADRISSALDAPEGLLEPVRGFGKVWRDGTTARVRERLGWAIEPERAEHGAIQSFEHGRMIFTPDPKLIYVLADQNINGREADRIWRSYVDTFLD